MLKSIIERCSQMNVFEKRNITGEYLEMVFYAKDKGEWEKIFVEILGGAVKPPSSKPTAEDAALTKNYGGIKTDQTLFKKEAEGVIVIAMFWPWQDGDHVTLKAACIRRT